jgi:hypothetical protein
MKKDHQYKTRHIEELTDPEKWIASSVSLFDSAKLLLPAVRIEQSKSARPVTDVFMMLSSYAIENLLKALIIAQEHDSILQELKEGERFIRIINEGHHLDKLALRANCIDIENDFKGLLQRLTRSATWFARYPAPLFPDGYETENFFDISSKFIPQGAYTSTDVTDVSEILKCLYVKVKTNLANQASDPT